MAFERFALIGGATRSGTTSLFRYLSVHPGVHAATVKEPGFFLEDDYPSVSRRFRYSDGLGSYLEYFQGAPVGAVRLEASADYLYGEGTPERIRADLPGARMIFILREPMERLVSWYRYGQQIGEVESATTLDEFVRAQLVSPRDRSRPKALRALEQGRYSRYLARWLEVFPADSILIVRFEQLAAEARTEVERCCRFLDLDPGPAMGQAFEVVNPSLNLRWPRLYQAYSWVRHTAKVVLHGFPQLQRALGQVRRTLEPLYLGAGATDREETMSLSPGLEAEVLAFYAEEGPALARLLGEEGSFWPSRRPSEPARSTS